MGIKTTHYVTKETALSAIYQKFPTCSDEKLGDILDIVVDNKFTNFIVVSQEIFDANKKDKFPSPYIESIEGLPSSSE
jgi:hypothetical protein